MGLLSGDAIRRLMGRVFTPIYEDGELLEIQKIRQPNGTLRDNVVSRRAVKVQMDVVTHEMKSDKGFASTDQRALILRQQIPDVPYLTADFRLVARGKVWLLNGVTTDPAQSYFEARASLSGSGIE